MIFRARSVDAMILQIMEGSAPVVIPLAGAAVTAAHPHECDSVGIILSQFGESPSYAEPLAKLGYEWCTDFTGNATDIADEVSGVMLPGHTHRFAHMVCIARGSATAVGPNCDASGPGGMMNVALATGDLLRKYSAQCIERAYITSLDLPDTTVDIANVLRTFMSPGHATRIAQIITNLRMGGNRRIAGSVAPE